MTAFYNEPDSYAAQWLENLIAAGHIAAGIVDRRPIQEIEAWELTGFTQCHFFAGIGVWSHALRRAGWSDDRPIWTGSCPCQPFSAAGQRKGISDERHLWPYWSQLIQQCRPPIMLGEQVASKDGLGWLDLVSTDMEGAGYAFGASDLCAAGFGGAHIRQRLYFAGMAARDMHRRDQGGQCVPAPGHDGSVGDCPDGGLADGDNARLEGRSRVPERADQCAVGVDGVAGWLADSVHTGRPERGAIAGNGSFAGLRADGGMAHAIEPRWGQAGCDAASNREANGGRARDWNGDAGADGINLGLVRSSRPGAPMLGRHPTDWLFCRDGKWRPVEPRTFPLADAAPARVGRLRAYGNALDEETAENFCEVVREICDGV